MQTHAKLVPSIIHFHARMLLHTSLETTSSPYVLSAFLVTKRGGGRKEGSSVRPAPRETLRLTIGWENELGTGDAAAVRRSCLLAPVPRTAPAEGSILAGMLPSRPTKQRPPV